MAKAEAATPPSSGAQNASVGAAADPYRAFNFKLDVRGVSQGHFIACTGLSARVEIITYREAGSNEVVRKLPGRADYGPITLSWGLTTSVEMWEWFQTSLHPPVRRQDISVIMLGDTGEEVLRWNLIRAWVSEWRGAPLDALGHEVAVESMVVQFEELNRG